MSLIKGWRSNVEFDTGVIETTTLNMTKQKAWRLYAMLTGGAIGPTNGANGAIQAASRWTIDSSSDGVSFGTSDKWGAPYDNSKFVAAGNGTAHSHMTLRCPAALEAALGYPVYLVISIGSTAGNAKLIDIGILCGTITRGTLTNDPTAANATWTTPMITPGTVAEFNGGSRTHIAISDEGYFSFLESFTSKNKVRSHIGFFPVHNLRNAGDANPWALVIEFTDTSSHNIGEFTYASSGHGFISPSGSAPSASKARTWNNLAGTLTGCTPNFDYTPTCMLDNVGQNASDGKWDVLPIIGAVVNGSNSTIKGDITDLKHCSAGVGFLARFPAAGTMEGIAINHTVYPFDTTFAIG
jgi:hypothetical protein